MANLRFALALIFFAPLLYAITVLEPVHQEVANGSEIYLGEIGPGQTISLSIDGRPKTGGMYGEGGTYELANVSEFPEGWSASQSDWAGVPLQVKIKSAKYAPEGEYRVKIDVLDEQYEALGNVTFYAKLKITHHIMDASLDSYRKEVLSGQPARFYIEIDNKAITGDVFTVSSSNVPKWVFSKSVYVPAKSSKTIYYEVVSAEETQYAPVLNIVSESSPLINKTINATVVVEPSLIADYKASNNGMLFFPAMNGLIYSLAGLISNLF